MLQKLENAYLAILRFLVIAVASVLLVVVAVLGFNSFKAFPFEPVAKEITPQVSEQELIKGITEEKTLPIENPDEASKNALPTDPNLIFYERTANAIITFMGSYYYDYDTGDKAVLANAIDVIKNRATSLNDPNLVTAYAKGLADSMENTLKDESVKIAAKTTSPEDVINKALDVFTEKFYEQIEKENAGLAAKQLEYAERKAEGMQSLYVAAGAFVAFLMIVFLSIIIRIERNLRHLENIPAMVIPSENNC